MSNTAEVISIKPSQKQKKWRIERAQAEARAELKIFKRDFFEHLPHEICNVLDSLIWRWRSYDWFEDAWNEYRKQVLDAAENGGKIKVPGSVFNKYINDQVKKNFEQEEEMLLCHEDLLLEDYLAHSGIKGMHWGIRRYQNSDGTLTEEGKRRYLKGYNDSIKKTDTIETKIKTLDKKNFKDEKDYEKALNKLKQERKESKATTKSIEKNSEHYFNEEKWQKDIAEQYGEQKTILLEGKNITDIIANRLGPKTYSKKINNNDYSKMSDDELRKKINRMSLEKQYAELHGDNKYVMSGRELSREIIQSTGAVLGIAASGVTIALMLQKLFNRGA